MTRNKWMWITLTIVILFGLQAPASAVPVTVLPIGQNNGTTQNIVGITGFTTTGSDMAGMIVTAFFGGNLAPLTAVWGDLGGGSGGASGSGVDGTISYGFELAESGDTFSESWTLTNTSSSSEAGLTGILIEGFGGGGGGQTEGTVFDRTFGGVFGTPDSFLGNDFSSSADFPDPVNVLATYIDEVAIMGSATVGDLFRAMDVRFFDGSIGIPDFPFALFRGDSFTFVADTDSIGLPPVRTPEPSMLLLLGAGLVALYRRRRS